MARALSAALAAVPAVMLAAAPAAAACGLALVLALDTSASLSAVEYDLQRQGLAAAFRDPEIRQAIAAMDGGIDVAVLQ